jgi:cyclophilin family peptidyl-prolyl cis-trans isomerase
MAKHKAPTSVTIAPTVEKSGFASFVERTWKLAAIIVCALVAVIIYWEYSHQSRRAEDDRSWERMTALASPDPTTKILVGSAKELAELEAQVKGSQAAPWALYVAAHSALAKRAFDEAKSAIQAIRTQYPEHPLVVEKFRFEGQASAVAPVDLLQQRTLEMEAWVAAHPGLYQNPALPEGAPRVRLNTDRGAIVLGLDPTRAPKHVENFLKLAREGYYTGTKFHAIVKQSMIQGGDPNSAQGPVETWGKGGPDYKVEFEENDLKHFAGSLCAVTEPGSRSSSGSMFGIVTNDTHLLDGQSVVFGRVVEGLDVVTQIELSPIVEGTMRPTDPVVIQSAEVL